ncbi:hypothetical protein Rxyl_0780 [Rubrobacter xylanophilus DSM 9941]|uniref:Uncharacterized protein n=1 Tax=Rubrobacter xylanophilus (strain DSM 9941 / JCM 11954 / NBRC 16129 / PRD-1) TaxID=266117 RepID=Q1AXY0_RUBXD|nr:hypothetical protein [Rubrobacter xylanophilus]ABG03748.1 hypothetical protein Rxyl_0780 [Rubrobacter xylanophilus DSM 9941]
MRGVLAWAAATALSFVAAAGMFLLLANMSARSYDEQSLEPRQRSPAPAEGIRIALSKEELAALEQKDGQRLEIGLRNASGRRLEDVEVRVAVFSENTAVEERRSYGEEVGSLAPGERARVVVELDLSPLSPPREAPPEQPRRIIEVRVSAAGEPPRFKTAILPPG